MDVAQVIAEVATQLDTIGGLRVYAFPPDSVAPPAAWMLWPDELTYDTTYGRGMDRMTLPVMVAVGLPSDRSSVERLGQYADGSGPRSIKQVVEAGSYTAFDSVRVMSVEFDSITDGGTDYAGARFLLDIGGKGAP